MKGEIYSYLREELYPCPSCYQCQYSDPIRKRVPCKRCSNNYEKFKLHKGHEADLRRMAREIAKIAKEKKNGNKNI